MCRMAAYAGPQAPLSVLLSEPPWSLREQAWRARLPGPRGTNAVNVDGTGVVWWPAGEQRRPPLRYVTELPPWADPNLLGLAGRLRGAMQLALVRSATPGLPYGAWSVAPFVHGRLAVAHNGRVGGFRGVPGRQLLERLPDDLHAELGALTDSAALAALAAAELRARPEQGLAGALAATVATAEKLCAGAGETATLTLLAADGERIAGVRAALGRDSHPLFTRAGGGVALAASEPLDDDPGWVEVPDRHLVELDADGTSTRPLD
jgi:gamma-glutamyl hercynylcysteine S-oxide hydrolase